MIPRLLAKLHAESTKTGKTAMGKAARTHFLRVWLNDDGRWWIKYTTTDRFDNTVITEIGQRSGWTDLKQELTNDTTAICWSGIPPALPAAKPAKATWWEMSDEQRARYHAIREQHGFSHDDVLAIIRNLWGLGTTTRLNPAQYEELCDIILPAGRATVAARGFYGRA